MSEDTILDRSLPEHILRFVETELSEILHIILVKKLL